LTVSSTRRASDQGIDKGRAIFVIASRKSARRGERWRRPHLPAGVFSPLKKGEKLACRDPGTTLAIGEIINEIKLLPVTTGRRSRQGDEGQRVAQPLA
jgi:hypothetical protein